MSDFPTVPPTPPPGGPDPVPGPAPFGDAQPPGWGQSAPGAVPPPGAPPWGGAPQAPTPPPGTPPWGGTPGWQGGQSAPPRKHGLATASLVLGIIGIIACVVFLPSLLALVFGLISLSAIKKSDGQLIGRSMALWGTILGIVGLVLFAGIVAIGVFTEDETGSSTDLADIFDEGNTSVFDIGVGDCIDLPDADSVVDSVDAVDCDLPHDGEVFATGNIDDDRDFPGDDTVIEEVQQACFEAFEPFVGVSFAESELGVFTFRPTRLGWAAGDSGYVCVAKDPEGAPLTGSVRDSGR